MGAGTAGLFRRKTPGTREPGTARRERARTSLSARSGRARRGGFRRRSGPGTWAASSSTSSRRWRPSGAAISVGGGARRHGGSARKTTRGARRWRAVPAPGLRRLARQRPRRRDVRVDAAPAARGGRSVISSASRDRPGDRPREYDGVAAMLTAEEEALRARTALMQRDAELARARAPGSASSRRRWIWRGGGGARTGGDTLAAQLARGEDDPGRRGVSSPSAGGSLAPKRRRRSPNSTRSVSTSAHSPQTRRLRFASCRWRRGARWLDAASTPPPRSTRRCVRRGPIGGILNDDDGMTLSLAESDAFDVTNVSSLTATQRNGVEGDAGGGEGPPRPNQRRLRRRGFGARVWTGFRSHRRRRVGSRRVGLGTTTGTRRLVRSEPRRLVRSLDVSEHGRRAKTRRRMR